MADISWAHRSDPRMKGGSPIGVTSQYRRGWLGDSSGETWFVIYKPQDGPSVELANRVSANAAGPP